MHERDLNRLTKTVLDKKRATQASVKSLVLEAVAAAQDKKAEDIVLMDMGLVSGMADYFILCTGTADLQIKAIVEAIENRLRKVFGESPWHVEGAEHRHWVLLDYVDLVVHVFDPERRELYDLERLWRDAPSEKIGGAHIAMLTP